MGSGRTVSMRVIALVLLVTVTGCQTTGQQVRRAEGLEGYWSFDEGKGNVAKNVVGSHHGQIQDGLKWVAGKYGKALEFNGQGYVEVGHEEFFDTPQFTVCAWTKLKDTYDYHYIIWKNGPEFPDARPERRIDIWVDMSGPVNIMWHSDAVEGRLYGQTKITDDRWHHVAEVYDGKAISLYVDGSVDEQVELSSELPANNQPMWIGARPGGVAATGIIDEVRFYSRALSRERIKALCQGRN